MKWQHFVSAVAFFVSTAKAGPQTLPVCIIGAGPAGLVAANKLEADGHEVVIFEKQDSVGGKCQAVYSGDGSFHPLGALLFSNATYRQTLKIIDDSGVIAVPFSHREVWRYNYTTGVTVQQASPSAAFVELVRAEFARYVKLRQAVFANYSAIGYKSGVPVELTVTTAEWLRTNDFKALPILFVNGMVSFGYGDLRETPILYMLQYFTPDVLGYFAGLLSVSLIDFHRVFVNFAKSSINGPIRLGTTITSIDRTGAHPRITYHQKIDEGSKPGLPPARAKSQDCSSLILAFPPTLTALRNAGLALSPGEHEVFSKVGVINYYSSAVRLVASPRDILQEAASIDDNPALPPPAEDAPVAFLHLQPQSSVATVWSWGAYGSAASTNETAFVKLKAVLSKLNKDPRVPEASAVPVTDEDVLKFVKQEYFPHFDSLELRTGFYRKFNSLQGQRRTYYASGLNALETVEFAVRAGEDIVASHFRRA